MVRRLQGEDGDDAVDPMRAAIAFLRRAIAVLDAETVAIVRVG